MCETAYVVVISSACRFFSDGYVLLLPFQHAATCVASLLGFLPPAVPTPHVIERPTPQ